MNLLNTSILKTGTGSAAFHKTFNTILYEFHLYHFIANTEKEFESSSLFKSKIKVKLLDFENGVTFF